MSIWQSVSKFTNAYMKTMRAVKLVFIEKISQSDMMKMQKQLYKYNFHNVTGHKIYC